VHSDGLSAARRSVLAFFFLHGLVFSTWVSRIPAVQQKLGLPAPALGLALLGVAMGSVPALPISGYLISKHGSRPVLITSTCLYCLSLCGMAFATNALLLTLALVLYGASAGTMDVSMNAHGVVVEGRAGKPMMSAFHALFSLGGMAGAAIGGLIARMETPVPVHFVLASAVSLAAGLVAARGLLPATIDAVPHGPAFAPLTRPLLSLGVLAFCFLLSEGAVADWTALYLRDALHANEGLAAIGYAVFSATMTAGRFLGDWLTLQVGRSRLVMTGSLLATAGLVIALVSPVAFPALVGFAAVGAGYSVIVPLIFAAAGRAGGESAGGGLAAVSTAGYFGFLVGPPLIGFLAGAFTLRAALWLLCGLTLVGALLARSVETGADQKSASPPSTNSSVPTI
jgi:MFS family permease